MLLQYLYNKWLERDKLNKELEHKKIVLTKENLSLKAMNTKNETLRRTLQHELNEVKGKTKKSKTPVTIKPPESILDNALQWYREN